MKNSITLWNRCKFILASAVLLPMALSAETFENFGQYTLRTDTARKLWFLNAPGNRFRGVMGTTPKTEFANFKAAIEENALTFDSRDMFKSGTKPTCATISLYMLDLNKAYKAADPKKVTDKTNRMTVELKSVKPLTTYLYYEGEQTINGKPKHYWSRKKIQLNEQWQTITFDMVFPDNLKNVWMRIALEEPAKIAIRKLTFEQISLPEKKGASAPAKGK